MKQVPNREPEENRHLLFHTSRNDADEVPAGINLLNVALLFAAAVLYDVAVGGAIEILGVFVLKQPLSWSATQVTFCSFCMYSMCLASVLVIMMHE